MQKNLFVNMNFEIFQSVFAASLILWHFYKRTKTLTNKQTQFFSESFLIGVKLVYQLSTTMYLRRSKSVFVERWQFR